MPEGTVTQKMKLSISEAFLRWRSSQAGKKVTAQEIFEAGWLGHRDRLNRQKSLAKNGS